MAATGNITTGSVRKEYLVQYFLFRRSILSGGCVLHRFCGLGVLLWCKCIEQSLEYQMFIPIYFPEGLSLF